MGTQFVRHGIRGTPMSTYTETAEKIQGQVLEGIRQLQVTNLEMVASLNENTGHVVPGTLQFPVGSDPKQLIERSFKFTTNVLDLQKEYLIRLTETIKPVAKATVAGTERVSKTA